MGTWVMGDVHGCYEEFMIMLGKIEKLDNKATIIIVGDIIDRGPNSRKMLDWAMENITEDGKYQMIIGNHEFNLVYEYRKAVKELKRYHGTDKIAKRMDNKYIKNEFGEEPLRALSKYIDFIQKLQYRKFIEVNGQEYLIAHAWYNEKYSELTNIDFRDIMEYSMIRTEYIPKRKEILIHGHSATIFDDCVKHGAERGKVWDKGSSIDVDCGLVYRILYPDDKIGMHGNLAAYNVEEREAIYLYE